MNYFERFFKIENKDQRNFNKLTIKRIFVFQIMSDIDFLSDLFSVCKPALENENHPLHIPFQYLLERLAAQKLEPKDLREFLRLGNPLACLNQEEMETLCKENVAPSIGFIAVYIFN